MCASATSRAPAYYAQAPAFEDCEATLIWHTRDVVLDGLNVLALEAFTGNIWSRQMKTALGVCFDQRADEAQRGALQAIFTGQAGGWPALFAELAGDMRGIETAPSSRDRRRP
jgi:hypothetical protein